MESNESYDAVVMPSRTLMLRGIPPELNNSDSIHTYFKNFGALLWVNEKYESDQGAAVVTFFSISDAIAAFMCNEMIMDTSSIRKSWFEYAKKCELCSYKYTSEDSIKQHMMMSHGSVEKQHSESDQVTTKPDFQLMSPKNDNNNNVRLWGNEKVFAEQPSTEFEFTKLSTNCDVLLKDKQRASNEVTSLRLKNTDLNDALSWTMKQRDLDRSEITTLNGKLDAIQFEKQNVEETLKETCKQLGEHELHLAKVSTNFEMVQKDKHQVDNEFVMTKMKNEDLSETLQRALEQRDSARAEVFTLYAKIQELKVEKEEANEILEAKYRQLDDQQLEIERIKSNHDSLLTEKERLENELNGKRDLFTENERMEREISSLKLQIENLKKDLQQTEMDQDGKVNPAMKENLQSLLAENRRLVQDFKNECKRLEEKDQDFKRVSMKYELLLQEKERLDRKLNDKKELREEKRRMSNEITSLKQELKDLSDKLQKVEEEKHSNISDNFTLNRKLHELQTEKENAMQTLKDECIRMGEKDVDIIQISANYGLLLKDKDRFDIELTQLQAERKELSDNLAQTSKQHDLVNAELGILRGKFAAVQTEKEYIEHSLKDKSKQLEEKEMELMRITTKYEWLMQETERVDNEVFCLTRQNENLNESYNEAAEQREYEQNELLSLNTKLNESQGEKAKISNMLKEKCMQLEAKTLEIDELSSKCDKLMKNQKEFEDDISSLNRKMHVLNDALSLTETDRDKRQLEIDSLNKKLQKQRIEMEKVVETLKDERKRFDNRELEHKQLNTMYEFLLKEKERLENNLKGKKEILEKKEAELTQLKQKTEMLNNALCRVEKEKDLGRLESGTLNEKLKTLQTEKESVIEKMKDECKRSEENELEFKRIKVKYELLMKEKSQLDYELKGKNALLKEKERMLHDIRTLNQKNEDLNRTLDSTVQQRDKERLEITTLNVKLRELQTDTERVVAALKAKCRQVEEKEDEVKRFTKMYEMLLSEKGRVEMELKAKGEQINEAIAHLNQKNQKLLEELQFKEQLLQNIKKSFNITPKKPYQSP